MGANLADATVAATAPAPEPELGVVPALRRRVLELERQSGIDRLTGLWTRQHFGRTVGREIAFAESQHNPLSLMLVAPDHLAKLGVAPGQPAGEAVVRTMAERLRALSRPTDVLFRWNAAELALLAPATSATTGKSFAVRLRGLLSKQAFPLVGRITISAGVGEHVFGEEPEPWVGRVTAALLAARAAGGDRVATAAGGASQSWSEQPHESMLRLVWSDELASGDPLIDSQHGALFDAANKLIAAMTDVRPGAPEVLEQVDCLLAALGRHFSDEEILLAQVKYPDLALHHRMHERLLEGARRLRGSLQAGTCAPGEIVEFLAYEVVNRHILKADREYFPYLTAAQPG